MLGTVRILPQESADQLKPAQQLFQLAGVLRHLRRKCVAGLRQPGVHHPGQNQRRHGHDKDRHQQDRADVQIQHEGAEHDAAPEHGVEERHIVIVIQGAQVGGQQREVSRIALLIVLCY